MTRHRSARAETRAQRAGFRVLALCLVLGLASPALAAQLQKVRVGAHSDFTRIVFQLDQATGYRVERTGTASNPSLRVTLNAATRGHQVGAHGNVREVRIAPGSAAVANIRLNRPGLALKEMILANPPRIVLDLVRSEPVAAATPKASTRAKADTKVARSKTAPAPKATPKPAATKPPQVAKTVPPKPAPSPESTRQPAPSREADPTPPKAAAKTPDTTTTAAASKSASDPSAQGAAVSPPPPTRAKASPYAKANADRGTSVPDTLADAKPGAPANADPRTGSATPTPRQTPRASKPTPASASKPAAASDGGMVAKLTRDPIWLGVAAGGLVALLGIVFTLRRRGRALPNDLDVTAISDEIDGDGAIPSEGFSMDESESAPGAAAADNTSLSSLFDNAAPAAAPSDGAPIDLPPASAPEGDSPLSSIFENTSQSPNTGDAENPLAAYDAEAPAANALGADSAPSPHDDTAAAAENASQGENPMNTDMDLPADPTIASPPPPPAMGGAAPEASGDSARMFQEFERRMQALESKLDASNEAREKLERQVAAQSEELRVQRAAIARTQRALRTMTRSDEEKATEPALREGETQGKTRVNV